MNQYQEHKEAKNAVENLRNHDTTINSKLNKYISYLGLNPKNLDLDDIAEDIRKVSGK